MTVSLVNVALMVNMILVVNMVMVMNMVMVKNMVMVMNLVQPPKGWAGVEGERLAKEWGGEFRLCYSNLYISALLVLAFPDTLLLCYPCRP